jgi:hypothetical protein
MYFNNFLFRHRFAMDYWFAGFPSSAHAIACILYYIARPDSTWAQWLACASAFVLCLVCSLRTLAHVLFVLDVSRWPDQSLVLMIIAHLVLGAHTLLAVVSRQVRPVFVPRRGLSCRTVLWMSNVRVQGIFVPEKFLLPQQWGMLTHFAFRFVRCSA